MIELAQTAEFLLSNRFDQRVVDNIPERLYPSTADRAYLVQGMVVSALTKKSNSTVCGYKLACTNKPIMIKLNVSEPFSGRMMRHSTHQSGVQLKTTDFLRRTIEAEFVFIMAQDAPNILPNVYTEKSIKPYIGSFRPGIEIVDHRYADLTQVGGNALIADNAIHGASILGPADYYGWQSENFVTFPVNLIVNKEIVLHGRGENVLGSPLNVMAWLANHLQSRGKTLKSGDIVSTGSACEVYDARAGDKITAEFGKFGSVSPSFA